MLPQTINRLTYANVMATIAVFIAIGGGAYAASKVQKNSVGSKQIKDGQVKNKDLANGSVTSPKVRDGSLLEDDFAAGELPSGPAGPAGGDLSGSYPNPKLSPAVLNRISALESKTQAQQAAITNLQTKSSQQQDTIDAQQGKIDDLQTLLAGVSRETVDGHDTLRFTQMNMQLMNGQGSTMSSNGLGNLIIGYDEPGSGEVTRTGSHYLVIGGQHSWSAYGGIVAGTGNSALAPGASALGLFNTASGNYSSALGGQSNIASGNSSSVSGGINNTASEQVAAVAGGAQNLASGPFASVLGGLNNTASGQFASILGGSGNTATGSASSVSGGGTNTASGSSAAVSGGSSNTASGGASSILGGNAKTASTIFACVPACP